MIDDEMSRRCYEFFFSNQGNKNMVDLNSPELQKLLRDAAHYRMLRDVIRELDRKDAGFPAQWEAQKDRVNEC